MRTCAVLGLVLLVSAAAPAAVAALPPATAPALTAASSADEALDALHAVGQNLRDFSLNVKMTESDDLTGDSVTRSGQAWFQARDEAGGRIRVQFADRKVGNAQPEPWKLEYLLDDGWLIDRDYRKKVQVRRQVLQPGQKMNLLKLGQGPFPLPIGQPRQEVQKQFEVKKVEPGKDAPAGTIRLQLLPKPGGQFEKKFKSIDVWVGLDNGFPRRIETVDRSGATTRTTELRDVKLNPGLADPAFTLDPIDPKTWNLIDEPFRN